MKKIKLTNGKEALVSKENYSLVKNFNWYAVKDGRTYYAYTNIIKNNKPTTLKMHRLIMDAPEGITVNHKNKNGLDNTRKNLRLANKYLNAINRTHTPSCIKKRKDGYVVRYQFLGEEIYLGIYKKYSEAKIVANIALNIQKKVIKKLGTINNRHNKEEK